MSQGCRAGRPRPRPRPRRRWQRERDRGAASILLLAVGLALVLAGMGAASIGSARVARHEARTAADLAALAGAMRAIDGQEAACARASDLATANGGRLTFCTVDGLEVVVLAEVAVEPMPGMVRHAKEGARAGPLFGPVG